MSLMGQTLQGPPRGYAVACPLRVESDRPLTNRNMSLRAKERLEGPRKGPRGLNAAPARSPRRSPPPASASRFSKSLCPRSQWRVASNDGSTRGGAGRPVGNRRGATLPADSYACAIITMAMRNDCTVWTRATGTVHASGAYDRACFRHKSYQHEQSCQSQSRIFHGAFSLLGDRGRLPRRHLSNQSESLAPCGRARCHWTGSLLPFLGAPPGAVRTLSRPILARA